MAEQFGLTTPIVDTKTTSVYTVQAITMTMDALAPPPAQPPPPAPPIPLPPPGMVTIQVKDNLGQGRSFQYFGDQAQNLIKFINTGNFTVKSLQKRILEKLALDGGVPGAVTGTPDVPTAPTGLE